MQLDLEHLLAGVATDSSEDGIRIDTDLEPLSGPGGSVKPAVYEGGKYQEDRRWASPEDAEPSQVIVIDNVPSQANRLEAALKSHRESVAVPEFVLDFAEVGELPSHLLASCRVWSFRIATRTPTFVTPGWTASIS